MHIIFVYYQYLTLKHVANLLFIQAVAKSPPPAIENVSFLHFNNPTRMPWHAKYQSEILPKMPFKVKKIIQQWLDGK